MKINTNILWRVIKKIIVSMFCFGIIGFAAIICINVFVIRSTQKQILSPDMITERNITAECILVLGAGIHSDGSPSNMLEDRLLQGISLYDQNVSDRLLMSGDHGQPHYDEVNTMKNFAISHGVPSDHIFMDHAGFSTYESLYRAKEIFKAKKIIIVTQKYHLYRALYIADQLGLEAYGVPSDPRPYAGQRRRDVREVLARGKDFLTTIIKPKPTYLGDAIPVNGSGDLTNDY